MSLKKFVQTSIFSLAGASLMGIVLFGTENIMSPKMEPRFIHPLIQSLTVSNEAEEAFESPKAIPDHLTQGIISVNDSENAFKIYDFLKKEHGHNFTLKVIDIVNLVSSGSNDLEIYIVTSGSARVDIGEEIRDINPGDLVICPPQISKKFVALNDKSCQMVLVSFPDKTLENN